MLERFILSIILFALLISAGMATKYQFDAGSYTVKFNSSQELVILSPLPYQESGSHAGGWDITIQDNMTHTIENLYIVEEENIYPVSNDVIDSILDNNIAPLSGLKPKTAIKLNGIDGRMAKGYDPQTGLNIKMAVAPFNPFYDSFFKRLAMNCTILFGGYDLPVYYEIVDSLNITTKRPNSALN
jgi:hypothetical protein